MDQDLLIAALLITLKCCAPKNVWSFFRIYIQKLVVLVRARMTGKIATILMRKMQ